MFSFKSSHGRCSLKMVFLNISRISQENTCVGSPNKVVCLQTCNFINFAFFPVKFAKILRKLILKNICGRLLLQFLSHGSMFIIYVIDLSTTNKMQRRGLIFLQKSKIKTVENESNFFSVNSLQKILIFHIYISSENAQCLVGAFL